MSTNLSGYRDQQALIAEKAHMVFESVVAPIVDQDSGAIITDPRVRAERLEKNVPHTIFESVNQHGGGSFSMGAWANAYTGYVRKFGREPSRDLLANAMIATEHVVDVFSGKCPAPLAGAVLESANINTTEGVLMRDRMVAMILPVMLQTITANMVSFIPGTYNQSEIFKIDRIAGSTFGDLTEGDVIDWNFSGQYSSMDQRWAAPDGDGTEVGGAASSTPNFFRFDSNTVFSKVYPIKRKSVKIIHDYSNVAKDDGDGNLVGSFLVGETPVSVSGTVNYATGTVNPVFSVAPAAGVKVYIGYDVDIEKDPTLIPKITDIMSAATLYPHESAIHAGVTLQSLWAMKREYDMDSNNMLLQQLRNFLSAERDRVHLSALYFYVKGEESWDSSVPTGAAYKPSEHYESVKEVLLTIDSELVQRTGVSGLVGLVAPTDKCNIFKSMPAPFFEPAPGWRSSPHPSYIGRIFGMWDLYEDPMKPDTSTCLCFAKGQNVGLSSYLVGDCIPPLTFKHPVLTDLQYKQTLWSMAYRDINPFGGREYLMNLKIT